MNHVRHDDDHFSVALEALVELDDFEETVIPQGFPLNAVRAEHLLMAAGTSHRCSPLCFQFYYVLSTSKHVMHQLIYSILVVGDFSPSTIISKGLAPNLFSLFQAWL